MAHSLTPATTPVSAGSKMILSYASPRLPRVGLWACQQQSDQAPRSELVTRRNAVTLALTASAFSSSFSQHNAARAASRRPPPPPPDEKKDPNVSGVQAKVLASKKRKEAMKQEVAKLREKGKPIEESSDQ